VVGEVARPGIIAVSVKSRSSAVCVQFNRVHRDRVLSAPATPFHGEVRARCALQLRSGGFIAELEQALAVDAHAAAGLELEITESLQPQPAVEQDGLPGHVVGRR
jgi:hypothetical protein